MEPHPYPAKSTRVIYLKGDGEALGRQHVEQLGDDVSRGMLKVYCDYWKRVTQSSSKSYSNRLSKKVVRGAVDYILARKLLAAIPQEMRLRLEGVSKASGISLEDVQLAVVLPDLMPMLQALLVRARPSMFLEGRAMPLFGCSSFISAAGKEFLHGRNLDFPGVGYWDRFPVIQVTERPGKIKYIGFCSAGVPVSGISGVNEAQVSVSLHQHYCKKFTVKGVPPFAIGEEILANARTLREAEEILKRHSVATSWAFIVTDGKTREAFICESYPGHGEFRRLSKESETLAHTNYFQTVSCREEEYCTSSRMAWDNHWRRERLETLVQEEGTEMTPQKAAAFLSDHWDTYLNREKVVNRVISQSYNIQSYVLNTETMRVHFAEGDAPVHLGQYREYDLGKIFAGQNGRTENAFGGYAFRSEKMREVKQWYSRALIHYFDGRSEKALSALLKSMEIELVPELAFIAGLLELQLHQFGNAQRMFQKAKEKVERSVTEMGKDAALPPEYFEICLYLARTFDLLGQTSHSEKMYRFVREHKDLTDKHLQRLARGARRYRASDIDKIITPFSSYVPFY